MPSHEKPSIPIPASDSAAATLSNGKITAEFDDRGLNSLASHRFAEDHFSLTIDGRTYDSALLTAPSQKTDAGRITYRYAAGLFRIDVVYELHPDWHFLSKQLIVTSDASTKFRLDEIAVFGDALTEAYEAESSLARDPRIIVARTAMEAAAKLPLV